MTKLHITYWIAGSLVALSACATAEMSAGDASPANAPDARASADAQPAIDADIPAADAVGAADDASGSGDDAAIAPAPYRHTVIIDGANDFTVLAESFSTTSAGYTAYLSWDDDALYAAYEGSDMASNDANKWVLIYIDTDPGQGTGAVIGELYNTQQPGFPSGFGAEYYFRWKTSGDFYDLQRFETNQWSAAGSTTIPAHSGQYVELAIALADLGQTPPAALGVAMLMINETDFLEAAYAGLYPTSFTDGYYDADVGPIPVASYLEANFASSLVPNDAANQRP